MMRTLLKKDWRVYRAAVVGAVVLAVGPYAVALLLRWMFPPVRPSGADGFMESLQAGVVMGLVLTLLMGAVFGGMAFAAERRDRSAEFLAMLPVRRSSIALSKAVVPIACLSVTVAVHGLVALALLRRESEMAQLSIGSLLSDALLALGLGICVFVMFFGLAWMLSLNLTSPAIAATVAIGAGVVMLFLTTTWAEEARQTAGHFTGTMVSNRLGEIATAILGVVVGVGAFVGSTVHYVRRVQP